MIWKDIPLNKLSSEQLEQGILYMTGRGINEEKTSLFGSILRSASTETNSYLEKIDVLCILVHLKPENIYNL